MIWLTFGVKQQSLTQSVVDYLHNLTAQSWTRPFSHNKIVQSEHRIYMIEHSDWLFFCQNKSKYKSH